MGFRDLIIIYPKPCSIYLFKGDSRPEIILSSFIAYELKAPQLSKDVFRVSLGARLLQTSLEVRAFLVLRRRENSLSTDTRVRIRGTPKNRYP